MLSRRTDHPLVAHGRLRCRQGEVVPEDLRSFASNHSEAGNKWCGRGGSNSHGFPRWNLNPSKGLDRGQQDAVSGDNLYDSNSIESTVSTPNSYILGDSGAPASCPEQDGYPVIQCALGTLWVDWKDAIRVAALDPTITEINGKVYAKAFIDGKYTALHRYLAGAQPGQIVDHIDGNGLNCRRANLRLTDAKGNSRNRGRTVGRELPKGVIQRGSRFEAKIGCDGKVHNLGRFADAESAARAYDSAAIRLFGEFARLNFPPTANQSGGAL